MGMYTNGGATLLCGSIGNANYINRLHIKFYEMKANLYNLMITNDQRAWLVVDSAITCSEGPNGSFFIHIGTEHKDYGNEFETILEFILKTFNNAEGFAWKIYEEDDVPTFWIIANGVRHIMTIPDGVTFRGYGLA